MQVMTRPSSIVASVLYLARDGAGSTEEGTMKVLANDRTQTAEAGDIQSSEGMRVIEAKRNRALQHVTDMVEGQTEVKARVWGIEGVRDGLGCG